MKVNPERMPFRFYNEDNRDNFGYGQVKGVYKDFIEETIKAYLELGGDSSTLISKGFITPSGEINLDAIIEDCRENDERMISTEDVADSLDSFKEAAYGFSGFLQRNTDIDKAGGTDHKEVGKKALENIQQRGEPENDEQRRLNASAEVLFAHMATGYLPRSTIVTAAQMVSDGAMMQIGCSQGKTIILAFANYIHLNKGLENARVLNTSSNPRISKR